jgi:hypothetical protein
LNFQTDQGKETINTLLVSTLDTTREDLLRSLEARYALLDQGAAKRPRPVQVTRVQSRMSDERADEFHRRLSELMAEFEAVDSGPAAVGEPEPVTFTLTIAFYPSFYFDDPGQDRPPDAAAAEAG